MADLIAAMTLKFRLQDYCVTLHTIAFLQRTSLTAIGLSCWTRITMALLKPTWCLTLRFQLAWCTRVKQSETRIGHINLIHVAMIEGHPKGVSMEAAVEISEA
jgi:hypothetical protein